MKFKPKFPPICKKYTQPSHPRGKYFDFFKGGFVFPHFAITNQVDVSKLYKFCKKKKLPFFHAFLYYVTKTVNQFPEFRQRIRKTGEIFEYKHVYPSFTYVQKSGGFGFSPLEHEEDFLKFIKMSKDTGEFLSKNDRDMSWDTDWDFFIYVSCMPSISFTSVQHPIHKGFEDSVPRFVWGKFSTLNGKYFLPFSVQVHHALMDGVHVGDFLNKLQSNVDDLS